jgi:putative membrane protein insertion efficiency factor
MRHLAALLIRLYQWTLSPLLPPACRFYPTCSHYALTAVLRFGVLRGGVLALARLARCHPWHPGGFDPVPEAPLRPRRWVVAGPHHALRRASRLMSLAPDE